MTTLMTLLVQGNRKLVAMLLLSLFALFGLTARPAQAAFIVTFDCIEGTEISCAAAEGSALLTVSIIGGDAHFVYTYNGTPGSLTDVFIGGGQALSLLGTLTSIVNSPGVNFSLGNSSPPCLPGAPGFVCIPALQDDSNSPVSPSGVSVGESVTFIYDLPIGVTYLQLFAGVLEGVLQIGLHAQSLFDGDSVSLLNKPPIQIAEIPVPRTLAMMLTCLVVFLALPNKTARSIFGS